MISHLSFDKPLTASKLGKNLQNCRDLSDKMNKGNQRAKKTTKVNHVTLNDVLNDTDKNALTKSHGVEFSRLTQLFTRPLTIKYMLKEAIRKEQKEERKKDQV